MPTPWTMARERRPTSTSSCRVYAGTMSPSSTSATASRPEWSQFGHGARYTGAMTDTTLPDRLSTNPKSQHYDEALLQKGVGIKFDGQEKTNVEEYCVSEGWIRVAVGRTVDRRGNPLTIKLTGKVEPYLKD